MQRTFCLARRLVEAGARVVTMNFSRWDWHGPDGKNFVMGRQDMPLLDQGVAALVSDLHARGLDKDVSVVVWGEFGRTPKVNKDAGRDHWPQVSCALLAGGGMRTGQVIGETNRLAEYAARRPVTFGEVFATLYTRLGINLSEARIFDPSGRPQYLVDPGASRCGSWCDPRRWDVASMPRDADGFLWDVLGLGCVAVDDLLYVPAYPPPDSKVRVRRRERQGGGLTGTALVAAARLGARCAFAGVLGDDEDSRFVEDCFRRNGVDTSPVVRRPGARPIRSTILVDETRHTRTIFFDLAGSTGADPEAPSAEVIRAARVLFVDHYGVEGMTRAARIAGKPASPWSPTSSTTSIRASRRCWG